MDEAQQRSAVVAEARSWIGTPYHSNARIKCVGVDCAQFPAAVYHQAGIISEVPMEAYSPQWHMHQDEERYIKQVLEYAFEIEGEPKVADFVMFHVGRVWAHGAIILDWPQIIHSVSGMGVMFGDAGREPFGGKLLRDRRPRFFRPLAWRA